MRKVFYQTDMCLFIMADNKIADLMSLEENSTRLSKYHFFILIWILSLNEISVHCYSLLDKDFWNLLWFVLSE